MDTSTDWTLMPDSAQDIERLREHCRRLVRRRAVLSAGVSAVPIPGVDLLSDVGLFTLLINDINVAFGLTPQQIERLQPKHKLIAYEAAIGIGGVLVGKLVTRELILLLLKRSGVKLLAKNAARLVPLAGQIVSAAIGFTVFRQIGYQHVEACALVARELLAVRPR
ncbi:hypothetical protein [Janthinobacterium sp.]|uniref:hypothetical protein n=1 Tax=Janthinobacterium sp. TaxID=1871054 RepID=UPI00293D3FE2|nr:hypothetical protein [Janthinobacterium sp.]